MAPKTMPSFLYSQLFARLQLVEHDLSGQTVIVTGANVGLGKEAARHLAGMSPSRLILAVRNLAKGKEAADDVITTTGNKNVEVWQLDLSSFASVKAFAQKVHSDLTRLDILIENAGIAAGEWRRTDDGHESTLQVNGISTALLALLILPKMRETVKTFQTKARIVIVGSEVHYWAKTVEMQSASPITQLNKEEAFVPDDRYRVSKLLSLFIARALGESLTNSSVAEDQSITVNCVNPGLCHSELARDAGWFLYIMKLLLARTTEYGARNLVWAALFEQDVQGEYISDCAIHEPSDFAISSAGQDAQKNVWKDFESIFAKVAPEANGVF